MKTYLKVSSFLFVLLLSGCDVLEGVTFIQRGDTLEPPTINETPLNETNETTSEPKKETQVVSYLEDGLYYFISSTSVVVLGNKTSIVVDAGGHNAISTLRKYNKTPDAVIHTLDIPEKTNGLQYLLLISKPHKLFYSGIGDSHKIYLKHTDKWNMAKEIIDRDKQVLFPDLSLKFMPPYEKKGLSNNANHNSLVVQLQNLLYMSNCDEGCEGFVNTEAKYVVLANGGKCPTNSFSFITSVGAEYIFGEELCEDFLNNAHLGSVEEMSSLGVNFRKITNVVGVKDE